MAKGGAHGNKRGTTSGPGYVGRRAADRRRELDLTREQVAERAGMDPGYLEYVEKHSAQLETGQLWRLAGALETTYHALPGGDVELPPGRGGAAAHPRLESLDRAECRRLLGDGGIGRFVFMTDGAPMAVPVNYGDIVFRAAAGSTLAAAAGRSASFEVDHLDEVVSEGGASWSLAASSRSTMPANGDGSMRSASSRGPAAGVACTCVWRGRDDRATDRCSLTAEQTRRHDIGGVRAAGYRGACASVASTYGEWRRG